MRRFISLVVVLTALLLVTHDGRAGVVAQDESTSMAGHPMVGTWLIEPTTAEPPELFFASADGIAASTSAEGTGYGSWVATGDRTADATVWFPLVDPEAGFLGMATMRASVEASADGQSFAGTYTVEPPAAMAEAMAGRSASSAPAMCPVSASWSNRWANPWHPCPRWRRRLRQSSPGHGHRCSRYARGPSHEGRASSPVGG